MHIVNVETILLSYRYEHAEAWKWSGGATLQRNAVLVRITTDAGIEGIGEIGETAFIPRAVERIIDDQFKPMLVGEDPFDIERLWQKMYIRSMHWGRKGVTIPVISGIDIALWDLIGKALNKPVYDLIGGKYRRKVRAYASAGMAKSVDGLITELKKYIDEGYSALKLRIGKHAREEVEMIKAVREGIGNKVDLMVDAGQCYVDFPWDYNTVFKVAKQLEECELYWLEEPFIPDNLDGYARLTNSVSVPIAGGENEFTKFGFKDLIVNRAVDILQPDVTRSGGITEVKKIAAMAQAFHTETAPHIFGAGIGLMANMHYIASTPNVLVMEYDRTINPLRDDLLLDPIKYKDGYIAMPSDRPGLGVELSDEIIAKYPYNPNQCVQKGQFWPHT